MISPGNLKVQAGPRSEIKILVKFPVVADASVEQRIFVRNNALLQVALNRTVPTHQSTANRPTGKIIF